MYEMLVKPKEKYDVQHKDMPVQKKPCSKYEPLGYTRRSPAESRQEHYFLQEPKSMKMESENNSGDGGVIQMWKFIPEPVSDPNSSTVETDFEWDDKDEERLFYVNMTTAIILATAKLTFMRYYALASGIPAMSILVQYAQEVLDVLKDEDLAIYPTCDTSILGKSGYNIHAITINVNMVTQNTVEMIKETAKTLIHEAFHIIGGCWEQINTLSGEATPRTDETSCTSSDLEAMLLNMSGKDKIDINADTFAQFVMEAKPEYFYGGK